MEIVRSSGSAEHAASNGYATTYANFNFGGLDEDREVLLHAALDRLAMLKEIDQAFVKNGRTEEEMEVTRNAEVKHRMSVPSKGNDRVEKIFRDETSHFLLRVGLSKSRECRDFLLKTESALLASRLSRAGPETVRSVVDACENIHIEVVGRAEYAELEVHLSAVARGCRKSTLARDSNYYKVDFSLVPSQVASRRVFVHQGRAYIPEVYLIDILVSQFRASLSKSLVDISRSVSYAANDARFGALLHEIDNHYNALGSDQKTRWQQSSQGDLSLPELRQDRPPEGMPLCMSTILTRLKERHHLRHGGRMQLGLFLKSCGLSMEESLTFWKDEFGKGSITSDRFEKQYAYSIRHIYGREGRRKELGCYGCIKIINATPGPDEGHGCPYREFDEGRLTSSLIGAGVTRDKVGSILERAKNGHYQVACGMTFDAVEPVLSEEDRLNVSNPAEYFIKSRLLRKRSTEEAANE